MFCALQVFTMVRSTLLYLTRNQYIGRQAETQKYLTERRQTRALKSCEHERIWPVADKRARWNKTEPSQMRAVTAENLRGHTFARRKGFWQCYFIPQVFEASKFLTLVKNSSLQDFSATAKRWKGALCAILCTDLEWAFTDPLARAEYPFCAPFAERDTFQCSLLRVSSRFCHYFCKTKVSLQWVSAVLTQNLHRGIRI